MCCWLFVCRSKNNKQQTINMSRVHKWYTSNLHKLHFAEVWIWFPYINYGHTNSRSGSRWHKWSTQAGGPAWYCLYSYTTFIEEVLFYWQFGIGIGEAFYFTCFVQKLCWLLAGVSFYDPWSNWRAGRQDHVFLLVWPKWILCFGFQH